MNDTRIPSSDEDHGYRVFIVSVTLVVSLGMAGVFLGMAIQYRSLIRAELLHRARVDFDNIVMMRKWNAQFGGVFVEKKAGMKSNPYLANPDITSADGQVFTKKNPALMTREISEMFEKCADYSFHITSLKPINPGNASDKAESEALQAFEQGEKERYWYENRNGRTYFRFMAPLVVEDNCLACHEAQGYKEGQIRGGISVQFDASHTEDVLRRTLWGIAASAMITIGLLLVLIYYFFRRLARKLSEARQQLEVMATTDPLLGIANRRTALDRLETEMNRHVRHGEGLCCALADIDHFKRVNDDHGHLIGDEILRGVAAALQRALRPYDVVGRYGGEEFLIIMPQTSLQSAAAVAERLRHEVESTVFLPDAAESPVTISLGVALLRREDTAASLIQRADQCLYQAKSDGRNRVVAEG